MEYYIGNKIIILLGVLMCACNSSTLETEWEDLKFKANLGYIVRLCLRKKKKQKCKKEKRN
jgi:hypothetical protein